MIYIGTTNFMQKNRFGSVWTGTMDCKRPVLGGSVRFPQYLGWSWTGCGPRLPILGAKNRTELDLRTLHRTVVACVSIDHATCWTSKFRKIWTCGQTSHSLHPISPHSSFPLIWWQGLHHPPPLCHHHQPPPSLVIIVQLPLTAAPRWQQQWPGTSTDVPRRPDGDDGHCPRFSRWATWTHYSPPLFIQDTAATLLLVTYQPTTDEWCQTTDDQVSHLTTILSPFLTTEGGPRH